MNDHLTVKNTALTRLVSLKGVAANEEVPGKESIEEVATSEHIGEAQGWDWKKFINGTSEKRTYWIAAGISLALILTFVLAVKYKVIKL
jgi:type IV secretory pathway component VirB8